LTCGPRYNSPATQALATFEVTAKAGKEWTPVLADQVCKYFEANGGKNK
jgi:hypothetical protein